MGRQKNRDDSILQRKQRKQIGKFGIGKLATYAVANRVTYTTKTQCDYLAVTIDYRDFVSKPDATTTSLHLTVRKLDPEELWENEAFQSAVDAIGHDRSNLDGLESWTFVILEELKNKAARMTAGRLKWVLRTAMPLRSNFKLFLNAEEVESSKEDHKILVNFDIGSLDVERIKGLSAKTGESWTSNQGGLFSTSFPSGITGTAIITQQTLGGKSLDLGRSNGFFVYVRGRLVNEEDDRFGLHVYSLGTYNRFRAEIYVDDLDGILTANRESMEDVKLFRDAQSLLNEVFNQARQLYEDHLAEVRRKELGKQEEKRSWVSNRLVELPTADALASYSRDLHGADADESWMYLNVDPDSDVSVVTSALYSNISRELPYTYKYVAQGRSGRLVRFDPENATFTINEDHELVAAYAKEPAAQNLLHDLVTGEALLEVYLREAGVNPSVVGEVLEKRDLLLRGLADSHMFSLSALSDYIKDSASQSTELEIAVVAGARALGFVAKHIGGNGHPDGLARFADFPSGEQKIILEAKSSVEVPSAKDIDFAAISKHKTDYRATGCLLVAPGYQGDDDGNAAFSAKELRISCWTVDQFAEVIRSAEARQISARQVLEIVHNEFSQDQVSSRIEKLLADPSWEHRALYLAVVNALRNLHSILPDSNRNVSMIATEIAKMDGFNGIQREDIRQAISHLAGASQGGLLLSNDDVIPNVDYDELERRVQNLTGAPGVPRRMGAFGELDDAQ